MAAARAVGRYELLRELGHGGTATVYLARQVDLGRLVALKELSALPLSDRLTARRFVRESRLSASLNHPNVVTVHDYFEHHGTPYIAMEYLARGSLRPLTHELTFAQVAGVLEGLLAGLGYAHEHGIVHRDLKPENLMVSSDGRVKIADFGIAKVTDEAQAGTMLTVKGTTIGTPTYMAPEQAMGRDIGPWTDLYAVGVVAFELLAGRPPFETTGTPMALLLRHVNEQPLELAALDPSVDPRLSDWVGRLLAKEPEDRTPSAGSASLAFEEIVLDRLGPRWRHKARLLASPQAARTPATMPMAQDETDQRAIPTAMPRVAALPGPSGRSATRPRRGAAAAGAVAAAGGATARRGSTARRGATARRGSAAWGAASARRLVGALLFLTALVVAMATAFSAGSGTGSGGGSGAARTAPAATRTTTPAATAPAAATPAATPTATPRAATPTATPPVATATATAPPRSAGSGVGDSQSDDPSDDEPDVGEP